MKQTDTEFANFYNQALLPEIKRCRTIGSEAKKELEDLQNGLIATYVKALVAAPLVIAAIILTLYLLKTITDIASTIMIITLFVSLFVAAFLKSIKEENDKEKNEIEYSAQKKVQKIYKHSIFLQVFRYYYSDVKYLPDEHFSLKTVRNSLLFYPAPREIEGEDYIGIPIGESVVRFSQIRTGNNFYGLFGTVTFSKNFKKRTLIISKRQMSVYHKLGLNLSSYMQQGEFVEIESQEFADRFVIFTEDQIEARYILSPALMQRILDYDDRIKNGISMSFIKNVVYFRIPIKEDLFDLDFTGKNNQYGTIVRHKNYFLYVTRIVEALNLNSNIWNSQQE